MNVAAYTPDLMDRSRISSAVPNVRFVGSPDALVGLAGVDVVVVDLSKRGVMEALPSIVASGVRVVAFASHVKKGLMAEAHAAGCPEVLPRSRFFGGLPGILE